MRGRAIARLASLCAAATLGAIVVASAARATEVRFRSTRAVAEASTYAVLAECTSVSVLPVEKLGGNLFTFSSFRVLANIFGDLEPEFTLRLFGGARGDLSVDAPLVPRFRPGEQVVLLLGGKNRDGYPVVSIQGVFRTRGDPSSGERFVDTAITGLTLLQASDSVPVPDARSTVRVDDFVHTLQQRRAATRVGSQPAPSSAR